MFIELLSYARIFAVATECSRIPVLVLFIMIAYSFGILNVSFLVERMSFINKITIKIIVIIMPSLIQRAGLKTCVSKTTFSVFPWYLQ